MNVSCPDGPPDGWVHTSQHSPVSTLSVTVHLCLFSPSVFLSYLLTFLFLDNSGCLRGCWDFIQAFHPASQIQTNTHTHTFKQALSYFSVCHFIYTKGSSPTGGTLFFPTPMMGISHICQVPSQPKPPSDTTTAAKHRCIFDILAKASKPF